jgi:hypothetical protein
MRKKKSIFTGKDTTTGGKKNIPMDISKLETTISIIKKGISNMAPM